MSFPTMWYLQPATAQTSLGIAAVWLEPLLVAAIFFDSHHFEFLSLTGSRTGSSESTPVKLLH